MLKNYFYITFGIINVGLGLIGTIIPGLPTTIFMIIAAGCFLKSSQKLYVWVTNHRVFGQNVKNYFEGKGIKKSIKMRSIITMWIFIIFAIFIAIPNTYLLLDTFVILSGIIGTLFIIKQPTAM